MKPLARKEKEKIKDGATIIVGCDEVGRGSLAGPVVAAAVAWRFDSIPSNNQRWRNEIKDSKLLSPSKREELSGLIRAHSLSWGIGQVAPATIDRVNIHHASLRAMRLAINVALKKVSFETSDKVAVLIDGKFEVPDLLFEQEAIINGDANVFSISAASIVAKVYRDALMVKLHKMFPAYGFARHKGYGTAQHMSALRKDGLSSVHRVSFCGTIV